MHNYSPLVDFTCFSMSWMNPSNIGLLHLLHLGVLIRKSSRWSLLPYSSLGGIDVIFCKQLLGLHGVCLVEQHQCFKLQRRVLDRSCPRGWVQAAVMDHILDLFSKQLCEPQICWDYFWLGNPERSWEYTKLIEDFSCHSAKHTDSIVETTSTLESHLVGGIPTPLKNMKVNGKDYPIYYGK